MLLKQWLSNEECSYLLAIAKSLEYNVVAKGKDTNLHYLKDIENKILFNIIKKGKETFFSHYPDYTFRYSDSFFITINPEGYISAHKDWVEFNKQVTNFNIILQKPKEGGIILHGDKQVLLEDGDVYILDASVLHGVTTVKGTDSYYSLVLWFYKDKPL